MSFCEEHLPKDELVTFIGEMIPEFAERGYPIKKQFYYIQCPPCKTGNAKTFYETDATENDGQENVNVDIM